MAQTREIKKRMTAVNTIQRITKTMQMIATAKFTAALNRAQQTRPYSEKVRQIVAEIATGSEIEHPLITGPSSPRKRELLLVITSDRGLCGAYNGNRAFMPAKAGIQWRRSRFTDTQRRIRSRSA
jgi:F-type H+-transporting ATPase subunit gamma